MTKGKKTIKSKSKTKALKPNLKVDVPGIKVTGDGSISFSTDHLPASTHFFDATHFVVDSTGENLVMLFGQKSVFSKEDRYNLAVEISMPRYYVEKFLSKAIFDIPGLGAEKPFIESVEESYHSLEIKDDSDIMKLLDLPNESSSFRRFSANYTTVSMSGGQALIEFFEVPPDLLVNVVHNRELRRGSSAQSVISILTNVSVLRGFLLKVRDCFSLQEGNDE